MIGHIKRCVSECRCCRSRNCNGSGVGGRGAVIDFVADVGCLAGCQGNGLGCGIGAAWWRSGGNGRNAGKHLVNQVIAAVGNVHCSCRVDPYSHWIRERRDRRNRDHGSILSSTAGPGGNDSGGQGYLPDTVIHRVRNIKVLAVRGNTTRLIELGKRSQSSVSEEPGGSASGYGYGSNRGNEGSAFGNQLDNAVVAGIRNIQVSGRGGGNGYAVGGQGGCLAVSGNGTDRAVCNNTGSGNFNRKRLPDTVVAVIGNENIAGCVNRHSCRTVQTGNIRKRAIA